MNREELRKQKKESRLNKLALVSTIISIPSGLIAIPVGIITLIKFFKGGG